MVLSYAKHPLSKFVLQINREGNLLNGKCKRFLSAMLSKLLVEDNLF